jgi:hypothetical protein
MTTLACAPLSRNYGRIDPSNEVTRTFEEYSVNPQYRYYVTGPHINPNAIIGLDKNYQLDPSTSWKEVNMTPEMLKELIRGMKAVLFPKGASLQGFVMTDDNGRPVGVWYSILQARTFLKINSDGTVRIDTPRLDLYEIGGDGKRDRLRD